MILATLRLKHAASVATVNQLPACCCHHHSSSLTPHNCDKRRAAQSVLYKPATQLAGDNKLYCAVLLLLLLAPAIHHCSQSNHPPVQSVL